MAISSEAKATMKAITAEVIEVRNVNSRALIIPQEGLRAGQQLDQRRIAGRTARPETARACLDGGERVPQVSEPMGGPRTQPAPPRAHMPRARCRRPATLLAGPSHAS